MKLDLSLLAPILNKHKGDSGSLIGVLQQAQQIYGYLPLEVLAHIAKSMDIPPAKVQGVASFYAQFRDEPIGKYHIMLCQGTACHVNGSGQLFDVLAEKLCVEDGGTTIDGKITLSNVACLGCCSLAPAMMINGEIYGNLTVKSALAIIRGLK